MPLGTIWTEHTQCCSTSVCAGSHLGVVAKGCVICTGPGTYPIKAVNILKAHGKSARDSKMLDGYALNMGKSSQGMPQRVGPAKIACLDMNLQKVCLLLNA